MKRMASIRKYIGELRKWYSHVVFTHGWGLFVIIHSSDIGANLTDEMYQGVYHGSKKHEPDLDKVLRRAWDNGMDKMIITGGSLNDSKKAIDLANSDCKFLCFKFGSLDWIEK